MYINMLKMFTYTINIWSNGHITYKRILLTETKHLGLFF